MMPVLPTDALLRSGAVRRFLRETVLMLVAVGGVILLTYVLSSSLFGIRLALTILLLWLVTVLAFARPAYAVFACALWGPWIGITRRVLDASEGAVGLDPLLVIIPAGLAVGFLAALVTRRRDLLALWRASLSFRLVVLLTGLLALEGLNPLQGGPAVSLGGSMFRLIPLFAATIVAVAGTSRFGGGLLRVILVTGLLDALYGLSQTLRGFPAFDQAWADRQLASGTYTSLSVNGILRAFGTFSSASEYVYYLDIAGAVALTFAVVALRRRRPGRALPALILYGLCVYAEILGSARQALLLLLLAAVFLLAVHQATIARGLLLIVVALAAGFFLQQHLPTSFSGGGATSGLLAHEFGTLSGGNVLSDTSIRGHIVLVLGGIVESIRQPWGRGLGAASLAAQKFGGTAVGTEFDLTDMFVTAGILGGVAYFAVLSRLVVGAVRLYHRSGRWEHLAVGAAIIACVGEILGSGQYVIGPTLMALAGWLIREEVIHARHPGSTRCVRRRWATARQPVFGTASARAGARGTRHHRQG